MMHSAMPNWLAKRAFLTPERVAIVDGKVSLTFREFHESVQAIARKLARTGIGKGDFVGLLVENSYRAPQLIYALQYVEAVTVLLNIRLTANELKWQLQDSGCRWLIYDAALSTIAEGLKTEYTTLSLLSYSDIVAQEEADVALATELSLESLHTVIYTSGTTGYPKGVLLTNGNHWWSVMGSAINLGIQEQDRWLVCVPLFHVSGLSIMLRTVIYGMTMVIHRKFLPHEVNQAICQDGISLVSVVTSMVTAMLQELKEEGYPVSFRCLLLGGGPAPLSVLRDCRDKHIPVYQTYGMTETASQLATLSPEYLDSKIGSAGKALFPSELRIEARGKVMEFGEVGEIVVRGPTVTQGYLHSKQHDQETFSGGWLHTGDLGYMDRDGFLYVLDRRSDLIISGGENVYPAEIEAVLCSHPAVVEAGVAGIPHERWGQVPVAFVVLSRCIDQEELKVFCSENLAGYKLPHEIYYVASLPRSAANKLLRRKLLNLLP
ncbi:MAG: o-succinylbenzoate--CoA ligase [Firmicutes bacterium]|nr:o-succinylbenzoate--CoA ligase [Bacillota bacterium]